MPSKPLRNPRSARDHLKKFFGLILQLPIIVALAFCSSDTEQKTYEDYGDIYEKNGESFTVMQINHPTGWGKTECLLCHNLNRMHQVDRIAAIDVNLSRIHERINDEGLASCTACHGNNGTK